MQGADTTMLPCRRGLHLHKSAKFKTIFEQMQTYHKKYAKNDSKMADKSI